MKLKRNPFAILMNSFRIRSIQFIISSSIMLITILAILFVGIALYNKFTKTAEQNAAINTRQIVDQVNLNLKYYINSMMEISDSLKDAIYYNEDITNNKLTEQMNVILKSRKDIVTLAVLSDNGEIILGLPSYKIKDRIDVPGQDWFKAPIEAPANLFFSSPHVQNIFVGQHNWVVSLSREITFNRGGEKVQGVLLVDMNFSAIEQLCQGARLGNKGYVYLVDSNCNIVYHPQQQLINIGLKSENVEEVKNHVFGRYFDTFNEANRLITIETVDYCRWRIVGVAYMDEIVTTKKEIGGFVIWTLVFGILFVMLTSAFISSKISQPIKKLEKSMKMVEEGMFDINIDVKGEAEVAQLSKTFNLMVARIRYLMDQIVLEQEAKRKSELEVLQAQINPHFLYNTLNSVIRMVGSGKNDDVITMITSLSKLFRISINKGKNIITILEEVEHARNYLIIQKIRYKNKFNFKIEVQEETLKCKTIKLILQPIIENAIYHGIEYMVDEGMITISISIVEGKILFRVTDNGLGMKPEVLKNILLNGSKSKEGSGFGVKNVHERIQLYYGKEYGIQIESEPEAGTDVKIWLPLIEEANREEV